MRVLYLSALLASLSACPAQPAPQRTVPDPTPMPDQPDPEPTEPAPSLPLQGEACPDGACADGYECMRYYGFAGPKGGELSSCEVRCDAGCPTGQSCVTISDGPGQVCRPTD